MAGKNLREQRALALWANLDQKLQSTNYATTYKSLLLLSIDLKWVLPIFFNPEIALLGSKSSNVLS